MIAVEVITLFVDHGGGAITDCPQQWSSQQWLPQQQLSQQRSPQQQWSSQQRLSQQWSPQQQSPQQWSPQQWLSQQQSPQQQQLSQQQLPQQQLSQQQSPHLLIMDWGVICWSHSTAIISTVIASTVIASASTAIASTVNVSTAITSTAIASTAIVNQPPLESGETIHTFWTKIGKHISMPCFTEDIPFRRCNLPSPHKIPKGTSKSFYKMHMQFSKWHIVLVRKNINLLHFNSIFVHKRS